MVSTPTFLENLLYFFGQIRTIQNVDREKDVDHEFSFGLIFHFKKRDLSMQGFKTFMMVVGLLAHVTVGTGTLAGADPGSDHNHMGSSLMREWGMEMAIMRVWVGKAVFQSWP